jgi:hypothetical protein
LAKSITKCRFFVKALLIRCQNLKEEEKMRDFVAVAARSRNCKSFIESNLHLWHDKLSCFHPGAYPIKNFLG